MRSGFGAFCLAVLLASQPAPLSAQGSLLGAQSDDPVRFRCISRGGAVLRTRDASGLTLRCALPDGTIEPMYQRRPRAMQRTIPAEETGPTDEPGPAAPARRCAEQPGPDGTPTPPCDNP